MNPTWKRSTTALLIAGMTASLSGCGGDEPAGERPQQQEPGPEADRVAPTIEVRSVADGDVRAINRVWIDGSASDDVGVAGLSWALDGGPFTELDPAVPFSFPVDTTPGGLAARRSSFGANRRVGPCAHTHPSWARIDPRTDSCPPAASQASPMGPWSTSP